MTDAIDCHYSIQGKGPALFLIHGIGASEDAWRFLLQKLLKNFTFITYDLRGHGKSQVTHKDFTFEELILDLERIREINKINKAHFVGHSLGGKVAMKFAFTYEDKIEKLIVADIAPRRYDTDFAENVLQTLYKLPLDSFSKREEIDEMLSVGYRDKGMRLFLMKNLFRNENKAFDWRFNLNVLLEKVTNIQEADFIEGVCKIPTHFIRGENSKYITTEDELIINKHFSDFSIATIDGAGHWLHAEQPERFYNEVMGFSLM